MLELLLEPDDPHHLGLMFLVILIGMGQILELFLVDLLVGLESAKKVGCSLERDLVMQLVDVLGELLQSRGWGLVVAD